MRHILAWSLAALLGMAGLSFLWHEANRPPKVGNADETWTETVQNAAEDARIDGWTRCVQGVYAAGEGGDASLMACDAAYPGVSLMLVCPSETIDPTSTLCWGEPATTGPAWQDGTVLR